MICVLGHPWGRGLWVKARALGEMRSQCALFEVNPNLSSGYKLNTAKKQINK
jgi:hypothetical protein